MAYIVMDNATYYPAHEPVLKQMTSSDSILKKFLKFIAIECEYNIQSGSENTSASNLQTQ